MSAMVFLNGRFLSQPLTGVQRFSAEIMSAIGMLVESGDWPETEVLVPGATREKARQADARPTAPSGSRLRFRAVGRMRGHMWEQAELPGAARGGVLVSLGNTAPVLAGHRQVVVIHDAGVFDTPQSYSRPFRLWYKTLQHGLVRTGAHVVTVSQFSRARIVARLGLDPDSIAIMHEGADHILRAAPDPTVLDRNDLTPGRFAVVVGNRVAHKNLAALGDATMVLARRGIAIAIAGGTDPAVFNGIGPQLAGRNLGRVSDAELRALYENATCLLFPSRYEGFGLPPVEAMACGCPVVAFGGGAVEEICGDGALYFGDGDGATIGWTIERLLDEPGLAEQMRSRGRVRAEALSWTAAARTLGGVVRQVQ